MYQRTCLKLTFSSYFFLRSYIVDGDLKHGSRVIKHEPSDKWSFSSPGKKGLHALVWCVREVLIKIQSVRMINKTSRDLSSFLATGCLFPKLIFPLSSFNIAVLNIKLFKVLIRITWNMNKYLSCHSRVASYTIYCYYWDPATALTYVLFLFEGVERSQKIKSYRA